MESVVTKRIFDHSTSKNNLRYVDFLGDGDSKSFSCVKDVYPGFKVKKLECVGHFQKHVDT